MANQKISQYPGVDLGVITLYGGKFDFAQITAITISPPSVTYDSRAFDYFDLLDLFTNNIYNTDGQLTSIRTVDLNNLTLGFVKGRVGVGLNAPVATFHVEGNDTQAFRIDTVFGDSVLLINNAGEVSMATKTVDITGDYFYWQDSTGSGREIYADANEVYMSADGAATRTIQVNGTKARMIHDLLVELDSPDVKLTQLTPDTVPYLDSDSILRSSSITLTELGYLSGVTSNIQSQIAGISSGVSAFKDPCLVATTGNITLTGEQTIDGVLTSSSRVLVWKQTDPKENGIYVSSSGAWARATDFDNDADKIASSSVIVQDGSTYLDREFICTTNEPVTFGSSNIVFIEYGYAYTGSSYITVTGNVIDINSTYRATLTTLSGTETLTNKTLAGGTKISLGSDATYDMYYNGGSGVLTRLATGNTKVLTTDGSGVPTWASQGTAFNKNIGTTSGTVAAGDDSRFTDARSRKIYAYQNITQSHTGDTTNTVLWYAAVPGGTLGANDKVMVDAIVSTNSGAVGTRTLRVYVNTTNDLSGSPVLIGTRTLTGTNIYSGFQRRLSNKNSVSSQEIASVSTDLVTDISQSSSSISSISINFATDQYIIIAGQLANSSDTISLNNSQIYIDKT